MKAQWPLRRNAGWESKAQVRPSTRTADQKESYQITRPRMAGLWPSEQELPGFQQAALAFEAKCWQVGMQVLSCFADRLGFDSDFFARAHAPDSPHYQSTLRMLHYFAQDGTHTPGTWRAGAHTDFDCLTLLFQRPGQGGLQVLPGKEMQGRAVLEVAVQRRAGTAGRAGYVLHLHGIHAAFGEQPLGGAEHRSLGGGLVGFFRFVGLGRVHGRISHTSRQLSRSHAMGDAA